MIRPDGSQMNPKDMLPVEEVFVALVAFPFLIVAMAFFVGPRRQAALLSAATHGAYAGHQIWKKNLWDSLMHPDSDLSTDFFLYSHVFWAILSMVIWKTTSSPKLKAN